MGLLLTLTVGRWLYPFLAVTAPVKTDILVMEGWVHFSAVKVTADIAAKDAYRRVFSTGGPIQGSGGYTNDYNTSANVGAGRLRSEGVPVDRVQSVPSRVADKDRTYFSAVALREWMKTNEPSVRAINIVTEDVHARRTRLLFEKALGDQFQVGIIAVRSPDYDPSHWWRYSEGVREVIGETIAYLYARLIFQPS